VKSNYPFDKDGMLTCLWIEYFEIRHFDSTGLQSNKEPKYWLKIYVQMQKHGK